jgi:hypothetical protein
MDPNEHVKQNIDRIVHDIDQIGSVVRMTEAELAAVMKESPNVDRWASMKSRLSEVHARLDGLKEFALACERRMAGSASEEELDVWL